jgi:hypothetical protein
MRTVEVKPQIHYALSNADPEVPLVEMVRVRFTRHRIEEVFEAGKSEAGLAHYEARSWVGWHHHMTLFLLALWFLCCERRRVGGENAGDHGVAGTGDLHAAAASPGAEPGANCTGGHARVVAEGGGVDLPLVQGHRKVSSPPSVSRYKLNRCVDV